MSKDLAFSQMKLSQWTFSCS